MNDFEFLNLLPTPYLVVDRDGILLYKNEAAKAFGFLRLKSKLVRYACEQDRDRIAACLNRKKPAILRFCDKLSGMAGILIPLEHLPEYFSVSILMSACGKEVDLQTESKLLRDNIEVLKNCHNYFKAEGPGGADQDRYCRLLAMNTKQLFRVQQHIALFVKRQTLIDSAHDGCKKHLNIPAFAKDLCDYAGTICAHAGYRLQYKTNCEYFYFPVVPSDFITVFLSAVTLAMRMSASRVLLVSLDNADKDAVFSFSIPSQIPEPLRKTFLNDKIFVEYAASQIGCDFTESTRMDQPAYLLRLPYTAVWTGKNEVRSIDPYDRFHGIYAFREQVEIELSVLMTVEAAENGNE